MAAAAATAAAAVSSPAAPRAGAAAASRRGFVTFGGGAARSSPTLRSGRGFCGEGPLSELISFKSTAVLRISVVLLRVEFGDLASVP